MLRQLNKYVVGQCTWAFVAAGNVQFLKPGNNKFPMLALQGWEHGKTIYVDLLLFIDGGAIPITKFLNTRPKAKLASVPKLRSLFYFAFATRLKFLVIHFFCNTFFSSLLYTNAYISAIEKSAHLVDDVIFATLCVRVSTCSSVFASLPV